ncbi:PASTA domain-containing protein [Microbacterium sp. USTB-Y]|uniref:PASTA domain-containing protein n=2 Tax=unclassified Microbacterium TaxID=2609290 RepID=UPI002040CAD7|nr:PASTA domain-containing protein [Microbacterium sp. USTB-Y]
MERNRRGSAAVLVASMLLIAGCAPSGGAATSSSSSQVAEHDGTMPTVVNLSEKEARDTVLRAAPNARIKIVSRQDSGPDGVVLEQSPSVGKAIDGEVTLTVSAGALAVPDVRGKTFGDAKSDLESAGFKVKEHAVADPASADGTVIGQNPAAGARNVAEVTLDVARKDAATYLADLKAVESKSVTVDVGPAATNGVDYAQALVIKPSWGDGKSSFAYNLGRGYRQFDAVIGVSDVASTDTHATIEIQAEDGRSLFHSADLVLGQPVIAKFDVTDVLRMTIVVTMTGSEPRLVLGDPRLSNPR